LKIYLSNKVHFFEEKMYGIDNIDLREPIRTALQEYLDCSNSVDIINDIVDF
jgi:hypothetical protein